MYSIFYKTETEKKGKEGLTKSMVSAHWWRRSVYKMAKKISLSYSNSFKILLVDSKRISATVRNFKHTWKAFWGPKGYLIYFSSGPNSFLLFGKCVGPYLKLHFYDTVRFIVMAINWGSLVTLFDWMIFTESSLLHSWAVRFTSNRILSSWLHNQRCQTWWKWQWKSL